MVGGTAFRIPWSFNVSDLFDVGGVSERALLLRAVSVAVLLSRDLGRFTARVVRAQAGLVSGNPPVFSGAAHPAVSWPLSPDLLLLPRCLLQSLLGRPSVVRRRRAAEELLGRAVVPTDSAERAPLLHVRRGALPGDAVVRRLEGAMV